MKIPVPGMQGRVGAGTAIKRFTEKLGIPDKDCGCKERAKKLDRMVEFRGLKEWQLRNP